MVTARPIRLGISFGWQGRVDRLVAQARRAEHAGFDTVLLTDHLGYAAPLPPLVAIAAAVPSVRVGNLVINASFHRPALLARDLASVDSATGGRLEIGLGAGYVAEEFAAAGVPFADYNARVRLLTEHVLALRGWLADPGYTPPAFQQPPPILVAGMGTGVLSAAAEHADIVAIGTLADEDRLVEQVNHVKRRAGSRLDEIELSFGFFQVSMDRPDDLSELRQIRPDATDSELRRMACLLEGSVDQAADRIRRLHQELGISYFTFSKTAATSWATLERLVDALG
ncbi:LLM class F420-dependent oxidoreductase [Mycobacterium saskatchewanense]|nr:LLM class F420-dependent oxidoreductase [Mycobacterium saskatchewanense]